MDFKTEQQEIPEVRPLISKPRKPRLLAVDELAHESRPVGTSNSQLAVKLRRYHGFQPWSFIKQLAKKEKPGSGRRVIIGLFLTTVVISLGFWLKAEIPGLWEKISSPLVISNLPLQKKFDPSSVLMEIENLTKGLRGTYGVYVYQLDGKNEYGIHQGEIFPAASLMKLPVMLTLYQEAQLRRAAGIASGDARQGSAGQASVDFLETKYKLTEKDKISGAGILQSKPAGTTYTYRQLAEFMGQYSDNTANNILVKVLGQEKIQQTISKLGMTKTSFNNYATTPEDIGIFFRQLYKGGIVNKENQDEILRFLSKTAFEEWIPTGLPVGTRVAHKIGKDIGTFSDGGIVFAEKPFVLVIMSKDAKESEAKEVLPKITKAAWEWEKVHSGF